jgi:hypothetical protein
MHLNASSLLLENKDFTPLVEEWILSEDLGLLSSSSRIVFLEGAAAAPSYRSNN